VYDPGNGQLRYLIHFSDGGSGMRNRGEPLDTGDEFDDGGGRYRVVRVEPAPNQQAFGHGWAELIGRLRPFTRAAEGRSHHRGPGWGDMTPAVAGLGRPLRSRCSSR